MTWKKGFAPLLLLAATATLTESAEAIEIRDGAEYSVALPSDVRACILFPPTLFDPATCPQSAKRVDSLPPLPDGPTVIAIGRVELDDGSLVALMVMRSARDETSTVDTMKFASGMANQMAAGRPDAKVHGAPQGSLVEVDGVSLVRATFDIDGFYGSAQSHVVAYAAGSKGATYVLTLTGLGPNQPAVDALGYRLIATQHVAHPMRYKAQRVRPTALGKPSEWPFSPH
jgi:hypothetical protein